MIILGSVTSRLKRAAFNRVIVSQMIASWAACWNIS